MCPLTVKPQWPSVPCGRQRTATRPSSAPTHRPTLVSSLTPAYEMCRVPCQSMNNQFHVDHAFLLNTQISPLLLGLDPPWTDCFGPVHKAISDLRWSVPLQRTIDSTTNRTTDKPQRQNRPHPIFYQETKLVRALVHIETLLCVLPLTTILHQLP